MSSLLPCMLFGNTEAASKVAGGADPQAYTHPPLVHSSLLIILQLYEPRTLMVTKTPRAVNTSQDKMLRLHCSLEIAQNS